MQQVWVTYTGDTNAWVSVDLIQDPIDSTLWSKTIALPAASIEFMVQAVNGVGLVSLDDNGGRYYSTGGKAEQTITFAPAPPATRMVGDPDFNVTATSSAGLPVTVTAVGGCTLTGTTVHITAVGSCTLTAIQIGDATHYPATATATVAVAAWPYVGFFSPVDNLPVINVANAGNAIPVKFSLGGNRGLQVLVAGSPTVVPFTCGSQATDAIEEVSAATTSGLTYDATSGQYKYVWKTLKTYAGFCYQLKFAFVDGTTQAANFKFK